MVSHTYATKGTYTVTVTVQDGNAATAQATKTITISPAPLTTDFTFSPSSPSSGSPVTFTATVSGGTSPYTYSWNFGDGSIGTGNPASHTYTLAANQTSATYTVTLSVRDANSATATASHTVTVTRVTQSLTADFGPSKTLTGDTTFVAVISGGTSPYTCTWNFGDGSPIATGCTTVHTYLATGSYTVTLTVVDSAAHTAMVTHTVTVEAGPVIVGPSAALTYKRHPAFPNPQTWTDHSVNNADFAVNFTLTVNIYDSSGSLVGSVSVTNQIAPGAASKQAVTFTVPAPGTYSFVATLSYQATLPVPGGSTTQVTGNGGSVTGSFTEL